MKIERSSGVLLHITSLPGTYGTGTMGHEAYGFAGTIKKAGMKYWQILPVGPVHNSYGYSPYASQSTFAGNFLFISPEKIAEKKWFKETLPKPLYSESHKTDFYSASTFMNELLIKAYRYFNTNAAAPEIEAFKTFCSSEKAWIYDYALFEALSTHFKTMNWRKWDRDIAMREPAAMEKWTGQLADTIGFHTFVQFIFFEQWMEFKEHCAGIGIELIGDIPIYITMDSADSWANPDILQLDEKSGEPLFISGVPPDYFSETGQRWGNPLYRWENKKGGLNENTILWWKKRISHITNMVDILRIDHFRGFEAYWSIPADEKTAVNGQWVEGPGIRFFHRLKDELGDLPLIAEDLGVITPEVEQLRDDLELPGMKILQFAFDFNNKNFYLPHNINNRNCILYTGTHDNNTTNGWFYGDEIDENTRSYIKEYLGIEKDSDFHWALVRQAFRTVADLVIIPVQDILGYGSEHRMNMPGTGKGNWAFKLKTGSIAGETIEKLQRMAKIYRRLPEENGD